MTARIQDGTESAAALYVAFELGWSKWLLGFSVGLGQPARRIEVNARDLDRVSAEIARAKRRFGSPGDGACRQLLRGRTRRRLAASLAGRAPRRQSRRRRRLD